MENGALGCAYLFQDSDHIIVGITIMNLQREIVLLRQGNMRPKGVALDFLQVFLRAKVIQARFPNSDDPRKRGKFIKHLHRLF
jgi:hypothetical protein